jgi:hypothetical protein
MIVLAGIEAQQTHEVERVRMAGIERQGMLAAKLGFEIPTCAHMAKGGVIERGNRLPLRRAICGFDLLRGRPGFTGIHETISAVVRISA